MGAGQGQSPDKGRTLLAQKEIAALPPADSIPVSVCWASPAVAAMPDNRLTEMIDPEGCAKMKESQLVNDIDPHFRSPKNMRKLATRMAHAGMPCKTTQFINEGGLFCVIKKAELSDEVAPRIALRVILLKHVVEPPLVAEVTSGRRCCICGRRL